MDVHAFAEVGGVFALLTLLHFLADWGWQSHAEAMKKSSCAWCRAGHCLKYTGVMCLPLLFLAPRETFLVSFLAILLSHFAIDTYVPVLLWAKYVRRAPQFGPSQYFPGRTEWHAFREFASEPLGRILAIVVDQLQHLVFLFLISVAVALPQLLFLVECSIGVAILGLYATTWLGEPR